MRNKYTPNKIIIRKNYCLLETYNIKQNITGYAKFDKLFLEKIKKYKWHKTHNGYITTRLGNGKFIRMHHLIIGRKKGYDVDHINNNKSDNRIQNLRFLNRSKNNFNRKNNFDKSIYYNNKSKKWRLQLSINGKLNHIGCYKNKKDAIKKRQQIINNLFNN